MGLRKSELKRICVKDIYYDVRGQLVAYVANSKGSKLRESPALLGRNKPDELVLHKVSDTYIHRLRRTYVQAPHKQYVPNAPQIPPITWRLKPGDYDREAAKAVSRALGRNRLDVVLRNYLR